MNNLDIAKKASENKASTLYSVINTTKMKEQISKALGNTYTVDKFLRTVFTAFRKNPDLYKCSQESVLGGLFTAAQLGLLPDVDGQLYFIPYNNKRKIGNEWKTIKEMQTVIGYKGLASLFYNHDSAISLDMQKVCDKDYFDFEYGTESYLKHKPALTNRGDVIGYYAVGKLKDDAVLFKYMSREECMEHGMQHSKCYDKKTGEFYKSTPWATEPDAMSMKTVLIQLMKLLPKSIEIQRALSMDNTTKTKLDTDMFSVPDETNWEDNDQQETIEVKAEETSQTDVFSSSTKKSSLQEESE